MVSTNLYVTSFYFVLIGKIQVETTKMSQKADVKEVDPKSISSSSFKAEKQLLEAEMEAEDARNGSNSEIRMEELKAWFKVRARWCSQLFSNSTAPSTIR